MDGPNPSTTAVDDSSTARLPNTPVSPSTASDSASRFTSFTSTPMSVSSSTSSLSSESSVLRQQHQQQQKHHHPRPLLQHAMDPLTRVYPKPSKEINVAEALTREPRKWTLGYWSKNARDLPPMPLPQGLTAADAETTTGAPSSTAQREQFERAKQELRNAQLSMAAQLTQHEQLAPQDRTNESRLR